jgi:hypothetical protein
MHFLHNFFSFHFCLTSDYFIKKYLKYILFFKILLNISFLALDNRLGDHLKRHEIPSGVIEKYKNQLQPGWSLTDSEFRRTSYKYTELKSFSIRTWYIQ